VAWGEIRRTERLNAIAQGYFLERIVLNKKNYDQNRRCGSRYQNTELRWEREGKTIKKKATRSAHTP
jgi:hypothetical protein